MPPIRRPHLELRWGAHWLRDNESYFVTNAAPPQAQAHFADLVLRRIPRACSAPISSTPKHPSLAGDKKQRGQAHFC